MKSSLFAGGSTLVIVAVAAAIALAGQAPSGTYTATMGGSAGTASAAGVGRGFVRGGRTTSATSGTAVTMTITSYSSKAEIDQLAAAQGNPSQLLQVLSGFNHGSVTIGGQSFPVNAAYSTSAGSGAGNIVTLLSSRPLASSQVSRRGREATGTAGGYIRLTLDATGSGNGVLYTSTQVAIETDGTFTARAGASTATQLSGVSRR